MKILISTSSFGKFGKAPLNMLGEKGYEAILNPYGRKLNTEELIDLASDCEAVIAGTETYSEEVFEKLSKLRFISRCGAGLDSIDMEAAKKHNVLIKNTPNAPSEAVAELTVGLILSSLRKISLMDRNIRGGTWKKEMGNLLSGKTVGIIGLGRIGRRVVELLTPFNVKFIASEPNPDMEWVEKNNIRILSLEELLRESDIVTLHIPYSSENRHLINSKYINLMKENSILVNTSRGGLVDEDALYSALKEGKIKGVALDVMEKEPYTGKLIELNNVVLTSHIGSYAVEGRINMEIEAVKNLLIMRENQ
jgi:D-3-phosphoglycerate dehydrogenase